mmetsp:Transcript_22724/g.55285  ORF Transcript_22724/g.55285 Transcript_22724/m.55285 type:complete len:91 (+) Transcript_22724:39-311(+)
MSTKKKYNTSQNKNIYLKKNQLLENDISIINKEMKKYKIFTIESLSNTTNVKLSMIKQYIHKMYISQKLIMISNGAKLQLFTINRKYGSA